MSILAYLYGTSQAEAELDGTRDYLDKIMEAAEAEEPLQAKRTPLAAALKSLGLEAGDALQLSSSGLSLVLGDAGEYRNVCTKLMEPESIEKLAEQGWVALYGGDHAMSNEPAEFRVRFIDITEVATTDSDKPSETLDKIIKAGREFATQEPKHNENNPVEHPEKSPNRKRGGVGDAQDGAEPEGTPKGSAKTEAYQPKTGARCTCRPGVQRDNCPACEGTGWCLDFGKIRGKKLTGSENTPNASKEESQALVARMLGEGGHKEGCACGFCQNKNRKKEEKADSGKPAAPTGAKSNQDEPLGYADVKENLDWKCGRPKTATDVPAVKLPKVRSVKEGKLSVEELAEIWQDDKDSEYVQINDDGSAVYVVHGSTMEDIADAEDEDVFGTISAWMNRKKFWPNIWSVNDHGNVTLHDKNGNDLGGLV